MQPGGVPGHDRIAWETRSAARRAGGRSLLCDAWTVRLRAWHQFHEAQVSRAVRRAADPASRGLPGLPGRADFLSQRRGRLSHRRGEQGSRRRLAARDWHHAGHRRRVGLCSRWPGGRHGRGCSQGRRDLGLSIPGRHSGGFDFNRLRPAILSAANRPARRGARDRHAGGYRAGGARDL